jgi:hypothetical protein
MSVRPASHLHCATKLSFLYRVIVTVRQPCADHGLTGLQRGDRVTSVTEKAIQRFAAFHSSVLCPCIVRAILSHIDNDPLQEKKFCV